MRGGSRNFDRLSRRPIDPFVDAQQSFRFRGIHRAHPRDLPVQMRSEVWSGVAVLTRRTVSRAICQNGPQCVDAATRTVHSHVHDQPGQSLLHALTHHARFVMLHTPPFFVSNRANLRGIAPDPARHSRTPGESKIVCVSRVNSPRPIGETCYTAVETKCTEVGQRRRRRSTLRQVRTTVEPLCVSQVSGMNRWPATRCEEPRWRRVGADSAQRVSHRFRISQRAEERLHARAADTREEIREIYPQHDGVADMLRCE